MNNKASVVIPVFNSSSYIINTIQSVLDDSHDIDLEIILVDDFSSDIAVLREKINDYSCVKLLSKNKKTNASDSRNIGFNSSTGDYVFFLDADDIVRKGYLKHRLNLMKNNNYGIIFGAFIESNGNDDFENPSVFYDGCDMRDYIFLYNGEFRSSTISINKKFHKGTLFDPLQNKHQDWGFGIRCYDNNEAIGYDSKNNVCICQNRHVQMSSKMNITASKYFIDSYLKEKKYHNAFALKHYYIAAMNKDKNALRVLDSLLDRKTISTKDNLKLFLFSSMVVPFLGNVMRIAIQLYKKHRKI